VFRADIICRLRFADDRRGMSPSPVYRYRGRVFTARSNAVTGYKCASSGSGAITALITSSADRWDVTDRLPGAGLGPGVLTARAAAAADVRDARNRITPPPRRRVFVFLTRAGTASCSVHMRRPRLRAAIVVVIVAHGH